MQLVRRRGPACVTWEQLWACSPSRTPVHRRFFLGTYNFRGRRAVTAFVFVCCVLGRLLAPECFPFRSFGWPRVLLSQMISQMIAPELDLWMSWRIALWVTMGSHVPPPSAGGSTGLTEAAPPPAAVFPAPQSQFRAGVCEMARSAFPPAAPRALCGLTKRY